MTLKFVLDGKQWADLHRKLQICLGPKDLTVSDVILNVTLTPLFKTNNKEARLQLEVVTKKTGEILALTLDV